MALPAECAICSGVNDCAGSHAVLGPNRGGSYFESNVGSCAGRSGKSSTWSNGYKALLRQYWEAQTNTFEAGKGWVYWAWKQCGRCPEA